MVIAFAGACRPDDPERTIPYVFVREEIFINTPDGIPLEMLPNVLYRNAGYGGIVVLKNGSNYVAFDRACPNDPRKPCERVKLNQLGTELVDSCCGSRFDRNGLRLAGPSRLSLKAYEVSFIPPNKVLVQSVQ